MEYTSNKRPVQPITATPDLFSQLVGKYIQQMGTHYQSDPGVQQAIRQIKKVVPKLA